MTLHRERPELVLASGSAARAMLLAGAGLRFGVAPAALNEAAVRDAAHAAGADAQGAALALAEAKARAGSEAAPQALVIGADQILTCEGRWFEKPAGRAEAAGQLRALRGRTHLLATAVACARGGAVVWRAAAEARLTFRHFSDAALEAVLDADAAAIGSSVGGYRLEGPGVQLCERIEGDHFTILGLPLLPLLGFLRREGVLPD
jgi:nucleoside triphosphate pyrophosphatase